MPHGGTNPRAPHGAASCRARCPTPRREQSKAAPRRKFPRASLAPRGEQSKAAARRKFPHASPAPRGERSDAAQRYKSPRSPHGAASAATPQNAAIRTNAPYSDFSILPCRPRRGRPSAQRVPPQNNRQRRPHRNAAANRRVQNALCRALAHPFRDGKENLKSPPLSACSPRTATQTAACAFQHCRRRKNRQINSSPYIWVPTPLSSPFALRLRFAKCRGISSH